MDHFGFTYKAQVDVKSDVSVCREILPNPFSIYNANGQHKTYKSKLLENVNYLNFPKHGRTFLSLNEDDVAIHQTLHGIEIGLGLVARSKVIYLMI